MALQIVVVMLQMVVLIKLFAVYGAFIQPDDILTENTEGWPSECGQRNYCWKKNLVYARLHRTIENLMRNQNVNQRIGGSLDDRSEFNDVGRCYPLREIRKIYMIKDELNKIWYVPQTTNYSMEIEVIECKTSGRITADNHTSLDEDFLRQNHVACVEQNFPFEFPVLSQDENNNTTVKGLQSLYKGIPLGCSAKILA